MVLNEQTLLHLKITGELGIISSLKINIPVLEPQRGAVSWPTYNPYPIMGAPSLPSWSRGLPLVDIKNPQCSNTPVGSGKLKRESFALLQSLADVHPDVDAIYCTTMPFPKPFFFNQPMRLDL